MRIAVYYNATERNAYGGEKRNDVELFRDLLSPHMPNTEFVMVDSVAEEYPEDPTIFDGVILGGSAAMVSDRGNWMDTLFEQIRKLDAAKTKLWGVCFGHQAIAHALGGEVAERPISLGAPDLDIVEPQKWMHPYLPVLKLYAGNLQQVVKLPEGMRRIAIGRGNSHAMIAKDDHIVGLQFHPEFPHMFMEGYVDECLSKHLIDMQAHLQAKTEVHAGNDATTMAKWMAKFFMK